jgi:Ca-activated chloride channel family protein
MGQITFLHPYAFLLLLVLIPLIGWYVWKNRDIQASLQISTLKGFGRTGQNKIDIIRHIPFALRMIAITMVVFILARPQSTNKLESRTTEGIDIITAVDISGSMLAQDFKPDRLEAAKQVAVQFISGRPNDKIGLVIFSGESFTQCPLTTDHAVLINLFNDIHTGMLEDGTAIGMGLATAVSRIKDSKAKSKVVILLTDGMNNRGDIAPITAAEIAKKFNVRVYTIGVGTIGTAPYPIQTVFGIQYQQQEVKIDEEVLTQIAQMTGGKYFRATNNKTLEAIYSEIDKMEKTRVDVQEYTKRKEEYLIFAIIAIVALLAEIALRNTVLRNLP